MFHIVAGITSLIQHINVSKEDSKRYRPACCSSCGNLGLWRHGSYPRNPHRPHAPGQSLNPISIQRFYCPVCHKTCSVLPECIPPRRWYMWDIQQAVLLLCLSGKSLYAVAKEVAPSRPTIARWLARFKEQFRLHKDTLCNHVVELGRTIDFSDFWSTCFKQLSLGAAMRLCHVSGVHIP